ncbi:MAG TPA: hypothetical protein VFR68_10650 [Candidatus Dormibacteraeota bacterium]|nr:hypothetical protein [Candidatus Dormibacteraeota bacterium]
MDPRLSKTATSLLAALVLASCAIPPGHASAKSMATPGHGPRGIITTFAGSLGAGNAMALSIRPFGIAVSGNRVLIAERDRNVVRLVNRTTRESTIYAGNGVAGFSGDGGPATAAQLDGPAGIAIDQFGDVFISEVNGNRIRKVTTGGVVSTVAGGKGAGFSGDGGLATAAQLQQPAGLATDVVGNLYIADEANRRVRKVTPSGEISTVAPDADLEPLAIATNPAGDLFVMDQHLQVRKVTAGGTILTVAGNGTRGFSGDGGPATAASFYQPGALATDAFGDLFIADFSIVREVDEHGMIRTVLKADKDSPLIQGLATDDQGNLYTADWVGYHVRELSRGGHLSVFAGNGDMDYSGEGGPATASQLGDPWGVAADGQANVYLGDFAAGRVLKITPDGSIHTIVAAGPCCDSGRGRTPTGLNQPSGLSLDPEGNLFIADYGQIVLKLDPVGNLAAFAGTGLQPGSAGNGVPATSVSLFVLDVAADDKGNVYIADLTGIRKVDSTGIISSPWAGVHPRDVNGVAVDRQGNVFMSDGLNHQVLEVLANGTSRVVAGTGSEGDSGDGGQAIAAKLTTPEGLAFDQQGDLFIADAGANVIRRVDSKGVITTVAGNGKAGRTGDGGLAVRASLNDPRSVAVDAQGNLFIADQGNKLVRRVQGPIP